MTITSNFIWTWVKGSDQPLQGVTYGIQDVYDPANTPDARNGFAVWVGPNNLFYLFGGLGFGGGLNDLWIYNPTINQWKWIAGSSDTVQPSIHPFKGIESSSNYPGARINSQFVLGPDGYFYMFGGIGRSAVFGPFPGYSNELWRYNHANNKWAFLGGSDGTNQSGNYGLQGIASNTNWPGARNNGVLWVGSNNQLYLFGGFGYASGSALALLNDLWSYNIATNQWTWLSGSSDINQPGVYGQQNVTSVSNFPGARSGGVGWTGKDGYLYLFGGFSNFYFNDMWRFNTSDKTWTWIKGSSDVNQNGNYGAQNIESASNIPGARNVSASWITKSGQMLLFGGAGFPESGTTKGHLNDLWMFNPYTNNWTWLKGDKTISQLGSYGTKGVPADSNNPRSRDFSPGIWVDASDTIYLFGGFTDSDVYNDVWRGTMPCDLTISDLKTVPATITSGQPFNITWTLTPTIFPLNYRAVVKFKTSDYYSDVFTTSTGSLAIPAQASGTYPAQLTVTSLNALNCSDIKSTTVTVIDAATLSTLLSSLPAFLIALILSYIGILGLFLYDIINE